MADDVRSLIAEHQASYEVSPYYIVLEERPGGVERTTRRVQAGFDVDVYGVHTDEEGVGTPRPRHYRRGFVELRKIAAALSDEAGGSCSLEVIPFPATIVFDFRGKARVKALLRIRVSHRRGLDDPAGEPERRALEELEKRLRALGIVRR